MSNNNYVKSYNTMKTKTMIKIALTVAILCIIAPITIPVTFSPIPVSIVQLGIYLTIYILGYKKAIISTSIYILMGTIGLPVFSGYSCGLHKLVGPTGGYILGYIFLTFTVGFFIENFPKSKLLTIIGYILGNIINYILGTLWLAYSINTNFVSSIIIGVLPYIIPDILKIIIAMIIGPKISHIIKKM